MAIPFERRLYGHRGRADLPENTLPAFREALAAGATALELDVHLTRDGHPVVSHDPTGLRCAQVNERIADVSVRELRTWNLGRLPDGSIARLPLLAEVLEAFPGVRLNIDIKPPSPEAVHPVVEAIRQHGAEPRVTLASFSSRVVRTLRQVYRGEIALGPGEVLAIRFAPFGLLRRRPWERRAAQVPTTWRGIRLDSERFIGRCHALGVRVDYWVINDRAEADRLWARGADGLVSDAPGLLAESFRSASGATPVRG